MHALEHAQLGSHYPLLVLLLQHVSLLVEAGIGSSELVHHGELVVVELLRVSGAWLLALDGTKATWSSGVGLLRLPLLGEELGVQEAVGFRCHELVGEA